jgi:ankyrin repeat protein
MDTHEVLSVALSGDFTKVKLLIGLGADVNPQVEVCDNVLQAAAVGGYLEMGKFLVDHGADVNAQGGYHGNAI